MDKVVIFARVSTDKQEYQRQLVELREYCSKAGWDVVREFANKVSGEALKVIQTLNENGVSLFVKNYGLETLMPDGTVNPVASLICTILLEVASMERLTIRERMTSGRAQYIKRCREQGIKMGRPSTYRKSEAAYKEQYAKELSLLKKGISFRNVSSLTGTSVNTLRKLKSMV